MNIKAIVKSAIRSCITVSDIENAIYTIVSERIDIEATLAECEALQNIVEDTLEEAVYEELSDYS